MFAIVIFALREAAEGIPINGIHSATGIVGM